MNETLWSIYHDVLANPSFVREEWDGYCDENLRFAERVAAVAAPGAMVWIHDYQLQLVPQMLRTLRPDLIIGFFLHIPFPPAELFSKLPWRRQILEGLLGADVVGFQEAGAAQNFIRLVRQRVGHKTHRDSVYLPEGRLVTARAFPTSIDYKLFDEAARTDGVRQRAAQIRQQLGSPKRVLLGVDPLDVTMGICDRLQAFYELLVDQKVQVEDVVLVQVALPTARLGSKTRQLRDDIAREIAQINAECGLVGRPAVAYLAGSPSFEERLALYRAADLMVVTPFRDGMNLFAQEYVASRHDDSGALVLSEFAGADLLRRAYLVNPHSIDGMKAQIAEALSDPPTESRRRMNAMRKDLSYAGVERWIDAFLTELELARPGARRSASPTSR